MHEHNFDKILDFLCSGIMSKKERQNVRDELFDHLMCKYETNLAIGMDEDCAVQSAINDLGDITVIKYRLSQVHSYYPNLSMKKALNLLILGFCLMSFQINIIINTGEITKFIGQIIMLVSMFCMSKANGKLKKSLIFGSAEFAISRLAVACVPLVPMNFYWIIYSAHIVSCLVGMVKWFYLFDGLRELAKPYLAEYPHKIPFNSAIFFNMIPSSFVILLYIVMIDSQEINIDIEGELAFVFVPIVLLTVIFNLVVFSRVSKCLWQNDHEYQIETSPKKKALAAVLAVAIAVVPMLAADLYVSCENAETELYSIDDSDISESEYNQICGNLISYGIPEKLVETLPESEIEKFKDCVPFENLEKGYVDRDLFQKNDYIRDDFKFTVYTCAVSFRDEYDSLAVRYMTWIEYSGNINYNYSDYITMDKIPYLTPLNYKEQYNGDLFLILSEENGKLMRHEPLAVYTDNDYMVDSISGVKFEAKDNLLIYYGTTYGASGYTMYQNLYFRLYHRTLPLTSMRNPPDRGQYTNDIIGYEPFTITTMHVAAFPDTEETE